MSKRSGVVSALILCFPFIVLGLSVFAWFAFDAGWIVDHHGVPLLGDFVAFWVAGEFAHAGHAQLAYDLNATRAAQTALTHVSDVLPFNYPPHFLFALIPLSRIPYVAAFVSFVLVTASLYAWCVVAISGRREAAVFALAMPGFVSVLLSGQNACLTAALAGFTLLAAERRPNLSGLALAALTFKPQFGPLFPLALALERRWRVLAVATGATVIALSAALWLFGPETFTGFIAALQRDLDSGLYRGQSGVMRHQSAYGAAGSIGLDTRTAWLAQIVSMAGCVGIILFVHQQSQSQSLRNAVLLACVPLFTPHILIYDLVIVSPAVAFLWRDQALRPAEWYALAAAAFATYVLPAPTGMLLPLATLGSALARVIEREGKRSRRKGVGDARSSS